MFDTDAVPQMHTVLLARSPAVEMGAALREESREHTVLHVKHRHVLMNRQFEPFGWSHLEKIQHLPGIQIVAKSHTFELLLDEVLRRQRIRDVQRKIADPLKVATLAEIMN